MQPQWRTVCRFPKILKIEATYDPAIPPLDIHPEKTQKKVISVLIASVIMAFIFTNFTKFLKDTLFG